MRRPALILGALLAACTAGAQALPLERILLPPGFTIEVYASGLHSARGLAFSEAGTLFVGSKTGEVYAVPPGGGKARVIAEGLDMPVGVACNVCESQGERYANILRLDLDELNRAPRSGLHFGFPYLHGRGVQDPRFWDARPSKTFQPPELELPAHVAALGMRFYTGAQFPAEYRGGIFIAEHGSWNRSKKIGYRVSFVRLKESRVVEYSTFAQGWLQGERAWGRPADVEVGPDGALYVSDDEAGAVYRIRYAGS
jgi:glucose/arabinose dehydrogenase